VVALGASTRKTAEKEWRGVGEAREQAEEADEQSMQVEACMNQFGLHVHCVAREEPGGATVLGEQRW
jgi:hypothetical protein